MMLDRIVSKLEDRYGIKSKTVPWKHQVRAYQYLHQHTAAMLAMKMGTGKSKVIVDFAINEGLRKVLILCPNNVVDVWVEQFFTHAPDDARYNIVPLGPDGGTVVSKAESVRRAVSIDWPLLVIAINYESAWREPMASLLLSQKWDMIVLDESHRVKSAGSKVSRFAARLARLATRRVCLSGTPMAHSPLDIYGQYRFLDPRIFGTNYAIFKKRYAVMGGPTNTWVRGYQNEKDLQARFHSIALVVEADVLELPSELHVNRRFALSPKTMKVYRELEKQFYAEVDTGQVTVTNALTKLLRLQQVTSGHLPLDSGEVAVLGAEKQAELEDVLQDIGPSEKVVVFARFRRDLDAIKEVAEKLHRSYHELSGRLKELEEWKQSGVILGCQIQSGKEGISMVEARYCIYYSLGFSLGDYDQSLKRVHRPGQNRPVEFIHLLASGTVDEKVMAALKARSDVVKAIVEQEV